MMEQGELFVVRGATDGTSTTGTISLDSDLFQTAVTAFRIPKGMKAKVWFERVSGEGETLFTLQYTYDITAVTPTWKDIQQMKLSGKGEVTIEKRRPEILRGFTGKEAFRITWTQPANAAALAYVELGVEVGDEH